MRLCSSKSMLFIVMPALVFLTGSTVFGGEGYKDLTPKEAYKFLTQNDGAVLIDVRSQAEYEFIGHPPLAYNLPLMFWDSRGYNFKPNPNFKKDLAAKFARDVPVVFICRSGGRSMKAAQAAVSLGFTEVYNITEGFEGGKDSEGHRTVNGWKNADLPYTFKVADKFKYQPVK